MEIYENKPLYIVRLQIVQQGNKTEFLSLINTTPQKVKDFCTKLIQKQNLSIFPNGKRIAINIRESLGGENLKSISLSFYGLTPQQTIELIKKELNKTNNI